MTASALSPIPLTDVASLRFGHWTDAAAGTGCTVIVAPDGATGGVDVRGGAPASRETDLLRPENTVQQIHAVCLSGGSAFGLEAASGVRPTVLRAPYASFSLENWTQAMDLVSAVVSWNVDSGDWLVPGADEVTDTVVGSVRAGSIVLLTDGDATGEQTLEALPQIIDRLQEEGYTLVTLSELIKSDADLREEVDLTKVGMPEGASLPVIPEEED